MVSAALWYIASFAIGAVVTALFSQRKPSLPLLAIFLVVLFALFGIFGIAGGIAALAYGYYK